MEGFWVGWSEGGDVVAAYEVHISPSGLETHLHVADGLAQDEMVTELDGALANMLAGRTG